MAMYAIAIATIPLIRKLKEKCPDVKQAWYADDATGAASCNNLRYWWNELSRLGPLYGYHPNPAKTYLVVKEEHKENATSAFANTGVQITTEGKRHLGTAIGSHSFTKEYVTGKVEEWTQEVERLARVAVSQPQAAYAAFTHGLTGRWTYLLRTIPDIHNLLFPLETAIKHLLIPALSGLPSCSTLERDLLALPVRHGGLGIVNPTTLPSQFYKASETICKPLVSLIVSQDMDQNADPMITATAKRDVRALNRAEHAQQANDVKDKLPSDLKRHADLASEKGASSWLSVIPGAHKEKERLNSTYTRGSRLVIAGETALLGFYSLLL
ncbi:uncharacterized protein LOC135336398 [Halichondria panicea]|uniref:uncharacterized protein LOC135336398 n=1 Tax=Halichondria panicea TaxID=6063 RepID=UPI00312B974B